MRIPRSLKFALGFLLVQSVAVVSSSQAKTRAELRQAEKIALSLTGLPMPSEMRAKYLSGELDLDAVADELSKSREFVDYYAQFWTRTLGVQSPMDAYQFRSLDGKSIEDQENYRGVDRITGDIGNWSADTLNRWISDRVNALPRIYIANNCEDAPRLDTYSDFTNHEEVKRAANEGILPNGQPIESGTQNLWKRIYNEFVLPSRAQCGSNGEIMRVWWDPQMVRSHSRYKNAKGYRVPGWIAKQCGPMLEKCGLNDAAGSDIYMEEVNRELSMEAGWLISRTVADDKPFKTILTTNDTIMTGTLGYFYGKGRGKRLLGNFVGGKIADIDKPLFKSPNILDKNHYWVNRGNNNAGVLTTPVFHSVTNGRRSKANRAYETFLCRKFVVPDGANPDPADSNPDLTKRTYCAYCHRSLEPMAAFFNRFPDTGSVNFEYHSDSNINDTGRFDGIDGKGPAALGKILADSDEFEDCSVKRAFEFTNGRKLSSTETVNVFPELKKVFKDSNGNMRTLLRKLVTMPEFLQPKEGNK